MLKLGTDILKLLKDGAPHRGTDFIPPAMKDAVHRQDPVRRAWRDRPGDLHRARPSPESTRSSAPSPGHYQAGMKGTLVVK